MDLFNEAREYVDSLVSGAESFDRFLKENPSPVGDQTEEQFNAMRNAASGKLEAYKEVQEYLTFLLERKQ